MEWFTHGKIWGSEQEMKRQEDNAQWVGRTRVTHTKPPLYGLAIHFVHISKTSISAIATKKEKKNHRGEKANFAYKNNLKVAHSITRLPKSSKSRIWWQSLERVDGCVLLSRDKKRCYVKALSLVKTRG